MMPDHQVIRRADEKVEWRLPLDARPAAGRFQPLVERAAKVEHLVYTRSVGGKSGLRLLILQVDGTYHETDTVPKAEAFIAGIEEGIRTAIYREAEAEAAE